MDQSKIKINKAGYYIRHWYDDVYCVTDMIKRVDYLTRKPQLFYQRKKDIAISPRLRKQPDLDVLVTAVLLLADDLAKQQSGKPKD